MIIKKTKKSKNNSNSSILAIKTKTAAKTMKKNRSLQ